MSISEQVERSTVNAADAIRAAISELDAQRMLLAGVLANLDGGNGHGPPKVVAKRKRPSTGRVPHATSPKRRAQRGARYRQVVEFVTRKPGLTVPGVANALGIRDLQVYKIVSRAEEKGELHGVRLPGEPMRLYPVSL